METTIKTSDTDGYRTITITGDKRAVTNRAASYTNRYPAEKYGTCQISYFEKPNGSLEIQLYRSIDKYL